MPRSRASSSWKATHKLVSNCRMSATHQITISEPRAMRTCSYVHNRRNTSLFLSYNSVRSSLLLLHGPAFKFARDACAYIQNNQITSMHANVSDVNTHSYVYSSQQDALPTLFPAAMASPQPTTISVRESCKFSGM